MHCTKANKASGHPKQSQRTGEGIPNAGLFGLFGGVGASHNMLNQEYSTVTPSVHYYRALPQEPSEPTDSLMDFFESALNDLWKKYNSLAGVKRFHTPMGWQFDISMPGFGAPLSLVDRDTWCDLQYCTYCTELFLSHCYCAVLQFGFDVLYWPYCRNKVLYCTVAFSICFCSTPQDSENSTLGYAVACGILVLLRPSMLTIGRSSKTWCTWQGFETGSNPCWKLGMWLSSGRKRREWRSSTSTPPRSIPLCHSWLNSIATCLQSATDVMIDPNMGGHAVVAHACSTAL